MSHRSNYHVDNFHPIDHHQLHHHETHHSSQALEVGHSHEHRADKDSVCVSERVIDRKRYYISQMNDLRYKSGFFGCGATSLTEALADWGAVNPRTGRPSVHQPPTEADRKALLIATGTMDAGMFTGGPAAMRRHAEHFGLHAESYGNDVHALNRVLSEGKSAIVGGSSRPGHGHYVYIAGRDEHGYIVGDPGHTRVTHWSREHLVGFMTRHGFTAVWKGHSAPGERMVADAGGSGHIPSAIVPRQRSVDSSNSGHKVSGGNQPLFHAPIRSAAASRAGRPQPVENFSQAQVNSSLDASTSAFADASSDVSAKPALPLSPEPVVLSASFGGSIPRNFPVAGRSSITGDSNNDVAPSDDVPLEDSLMLQDTTDRIVSYLLDDGYGFRAINTQYEDGSNKISVGAGQWHQEGDLPNLFAAWSHDAPQEYATIFGADAQRLLDANWVNDHDFVADAPLMARLSEALSNPLMQGTQVRLTRELINEGVNVGYQSGMRSQWALAAVADVCNQAGTGAVRKALQGPNVQGQLHRGDEYQALAAMQSNLRRPSP